MINQKYALKYSFPHSVVHIIDNSARTVEANVTTANDPSLLSTLVVTGAPMGEDNKIISLTRSDVAGTAFGLNNLTPADVRKYGQGVTYAMDLINQEVPVQFMRITPPDATFAAVSLVVQWRQDPTDNSLHVRFKVKDWAESIPRDSFKNTARLNEALVKGYYSESYQDPGSNETWTQRAFINFISAGRSNIYNNMAMMINPVSQAKRPSNVKYQFITVDKRTSGIIERFTASLVNTNVGAINTSNAVDAVNTVISNRVPGSSIVIPYVNESVVEEVYNIWHKWFEEKINNGEATDEEVAMYNSMNINIFDMIFGKYIFNGSSTDVTLPFYVVDMETSELPKLNASNILYDIKSSDPTVTEQPEKVRARLISETLGVENPNSEVYVGDIFVTPSSSGSILRPKLSIITAVNQYTGMVTSMAMPNIYKLVKKNSAWGLPTENLKATDASRVVKLITYKMLGEKVGQALAAYTETTHDQLTSDDIRNAILAGNVSDMDIIIAADRSDLTKFYVYAVIFPLEGGTPTKNLTTAADHYTLVRYSLADYYKMFDREKHASGAVGTGNAFGFNSDANCWNRVGSTIVDSAGAAADTLPTAYVNSYDRLPNDSDDPISTHRIQVLRLTGMRVGAVPTEISHKNISGTYYDTVLFEAGNIDTWKANRFDIVSGGSGYAAGEKLYAIIELGVEDYELTPEQPADWTTDYTSYYTHNTSDPEHEWVAVPAGESAPEWTENTYYAKVPADRKTPVVVTAVDANGAIRGIRIDGADAYETSNIAVGDVAATINLQYPTLAGAGEGTGATASLAEFTVIDGKPAKIDRYVVSGSLNTLYAALNTHSKIPKNYYSSDQGDNPASTNGMSLSGGSAGFFDTLAPDSIEYKWQYSALLVQALRGSENFDRRILSPTRVPAKFMFDGGYNTLVGSVMTGNITSYRPADIINASIIFTDEEKSQVILYPEKTIDNIGVSVDIDVKQAMYDLMIQRCYDGIPEEKRPIGPGSGFQVYFDSGVTDADTTSLVRESFLKRFSNPNAIWDIGGFVERSTGLSYTFVKHIAEDIFRHINIAGFNKPYAGKTTAIPKERYSEFFPDLDTTDWAKRENYYLSGGNTWIMQRDGSLERRQQITLYRDSETSDLLQENNMRTLSRLIYLLQEKIDSYLLEYNSDSVLKTLSDEVNNLFTNWVGNYVDALDIKFERDQNIDGADILVCYCEVTFRGLILRVPIIVNVNARE